MAKRKDDTLPPGFTQLLDDGWGKGGEAETRILELLMPILQRRARVLLKANPDLSHVTADDLVNTVYVRLRTTSENNDGKLNYHDRHHFLRLAVTALYNAMQDLIKRVGDRKPSDDFFLPLDDDLPGAVPVSAASMDVRRLLEELRAVNPRQADALELHVLWGFTLEECGALLDMAKATVVRDLSAAKGWMKDELAV